MADVWGILKPEAIWHIVEYDDCPRASIYTYPDGRIICHPRDHRLAERVLADIEGDPGLAIAILRELDG